MGTHPIFESDFDCLTDLQSANLFAMGISRDSEHKRRATGGKRPQTRKKRAFLLGRPSSMTKLAPHRVHHVRTRGGNMKYRALRTKATSPGLLKPSQEKFVLSMSSTTPPTTNWSEPRPWSKVASSPSIPPHSDNGTNLTTPRLLVARRTPSCLKKKKPSSTDQNLPLSKRNSTLAERKLKLLLPWLNNSPKVVFLPVLPPDQVKPADATDTSLKAKNSISTSENSRPRSPNKCKDSNK